MGVCGHYPGLPPIWAKLITIKYTKKTEKGATNKIQNTNKQNTIHLHLPDQRDKQMLQINSYHRALEGLSIDVGWLPLVVTSHIYFFAHLLCTQLRVTLAPCAVNG